MKITILLLLTGLASCRPAIRNNDYLVSFNDTITDQYGYKDSNGDIAIPLGKYERCFTDTFKTYAIVVKPNGGFIAIDRQENVLYGIFQYDNGPDYPSEGLFRILENNKIGFADSITGKIVIKPQFDCAWPFENGVAKVSNDCKTQMEGEHSIWLSDHWFYIDKTGIKVAAFLLKHPLLTWMRKSPVEIGCMLESEFSFKDPVFNCDYKGYINKGDPIKNNVEYYEGITFPLSLVPKIHPSIKILNLEFEHGNLREIFIEFKDSLLKSKIAEIFDLPTERTSFPDNIIDIGYGENISASNKPIDPKFTKWLIIYGFDHIGAGEVGNH
ncbi:MAG: WG repeat-containing protein [Bacteroidetes bacterium]|nr:MAG: WG repeat-containing protein [Bacteroidota bacterium]